MTLKNIFFKLQTIMEETWMDEITRMLNNNAIPTVVEKFLNEHCSYRTLEDELILLRIAVTNNDIPMLKMFGAYLHYPMDPRILMKYTNNIETIRYLADRELCQEDMLEALMESHSESPSESTVEFILSNIGELKEEDSEWVSEVYREESDDVIRSRLGRFVKPAISGKFAGKK